MEGLEIMGIVAYSSAFLAILVLIGKYIAKHPEILDDKKL